MIEKAVFRSEQNIVLLRYRQYDRTAVGDAIFILSIINRKSPVILLHSSHQLYTLSRSSLRCLKLRNLTMVTVKSWWRVMGTVAKMLRTKMIGWHVENELKFFCALRYSWQRNRSKSLSLSYCSWQNRTCHTGACIIVCGTRASLIQILCCNRYILIKVRSRVDTACH